MPLETYHHSSSTRGLSSITTLIVGATESVLIDPPFLIQDAESVVRWVKATTTTPLKAVFVTHHHPDHFFSANPILEAFPSAKFYAAPYVLAGINREYDDKVKYWPSIFGKESVPEAPRKPEAFDFTFFILQGNPENPVMLLGPLQGDSVDHTIFWLPAERTVICGDTVYGRSTHVWVEEVETPALLEAWNKSLDVISSLNPTKVIPGHLEPGWELDAQADLAHTKKYLSVFANKVTYASSKPKVKDLHECFQNEFKQCKENLDFFLGHLSNQFGEGGQVWEENRHHAVDKRSIENLNGFCF
ncbi:MBL fold metallo-hydrolase [Aspergillus glaucus CBS 516.65]|uniref:Metallo-beta-lactamase domain-containing protein n=1 Tax=Aspergillus glaucus CBS 516.65 TaxID=1160497 RepID=A0A1L9VFV0_ASPGL|nr:hypothetical protein ASPGLDRAFT_83327 [Aspergillus glaucus CBS 516.65]OJJ82712.1 hypothetical protein ASPGLDRAFT_83327 [Aspergillus glaucus CBS 516.65]